MSDLRELRPDGEEPFYVRQTDDPKTPEGKRHWFHRAADEAINEGATWARYTKHPDIPDLLLLECWRVRPEEEGEPRWALTRSQAGTTARLDPLREDQNPITPKHSNPLREGE